MPFAARIGDPTGHGGTVLPPGIPTVLIGGQPAAVATNLHACAIVVHGTTPIVPGNPTVLIGGFPALRVGDASACGAPIVFGALTVLIG